MAIDPVGGAETEGAKQLLEKKVGPLPLGGWVLIGVGGVATLDYLWKRHQAANAASNSSTTGGGISTGGALDTSTLENELQQLLNSQVPGNQSNQSGNQNNNNDNSNKNNNSTNSPPPTNNPTSRGQWYTVTRGDTLWGIAARFLGSGSKYWDIVNVPINKQTIQQRSGGNPNLIYPGERFWIPQ